jgi:hypothetical protein
MAGYASMNEHIRPFLFPSFIVIIFPEGFMLYRVTIIGKSWEQCHFEKPFLTFS